MKRILFLLFGLIVCNAYSQSVVIDGYINNAQGNPVKLCIDRNYLGVNPTVLTTKTTEGSFSFSLNESKPFIASLSYGSDSCSFFLSPNDTLHVAFTADLMNITLQLSGNGAAQNLFLKKFYKKFSDSFSDSIMSNKIMSMGVDAFEIDLYNNHKQQTEYFKSDSSYFSFSPSFKNYFSNLINYRYWTSLLAYPIVRANSSTTILKVDELPSTLLEGFDKVNVNNPDALVCSSYRSFLKYYVIYFTSKQNSFNKFTDYNLSMDRKNAFALTVLTGNVYQYWLSRFMLDDFEKAKPSTVKRLYNSLVQSDKSGTPGIYTSVIKEKCGKYMEQKDDVKQSSASSSGSSKGSSDEGYKIVDEKGKPMRLTDFKGKVVYVDYWASWCGPCRGEMPFSKELHKKFTEKQLKNIVFLYVSVDNDTAAWRKAVKEIGMEGLQGSSPWKWTDGIGAFFKIWSIPHYMLIDKSGKMVNEDANRPSNPETYKDILNLLE